MPNKQFFAGLEEALARLVGVVLTLTFFLIYIWAVGGVNFNWLQAFFAFGLFWLIYEAIAFGLFMLFDFFAKKSESTQSTQTQTQTNDGGYIPPFGSEYTPGNNSGSSGGCDGGAGGSCD